MIPELGNLSLMLALCLAVVQGMVAPVCAMRGHVRAAALGRWAAGAQCACIVLAFACMVYAFTVNDFSVRYVAANSNSLLPLYYRVAAAWGGHEGSMLLWAQLLAIWALPVVLCSRQLPEQMIASVLGVMGVLSVGFLSFILFTSNPFVRLLPAVTDGRDLNPLLQDVAMTVHPPLLYVGYVGFSLAFSFAVAALIHGRLDAQWVRWLRPWTLIAWVFLTLGILLGSFWAYYELGWGGWWFWDAVENASLMPWLIGTALLHALAVADKRGSGKNWGLLLAIIAFALPMLGTFLVRSGVLVSVHAFAASPERGMFLLLFFAVVIGGALTLYAWRAPQFASGRRLSAGSREAALLINNVLLLVAATTVLLGTLYPLALDALNLGKISVGPPYFETVFVPVMVPVLLLLVIGPFMRWKDGGLAALVRRLRWLALVALFVAAVAWLMMATSAMVTLGLALAAWVLGGTGFHMWLQLRRSAPDGSVWRRVARQPRGYWGMVVAHAGIGLFVVGVTLVKGMESAHDVAMRVGESTSVGGYTFRLIGIDDIRERNYMAKRARFEVTRGEQRVATMQPERRFYVVQKLPMTEAAIDRSLTRDLYVSLGDATGQGGWVVRVQHKPFVGWIWIGCLFMSCGGLLAASDRRYRGTAHDHARQTARAAAASIGVT